MQKVIKCDGTHTVKVAYNLLEKQNRLQFSDRFFYLWPNLCKARKARVFLPNALKPSSSIGPDYAPFITFELTREIYLINPPYLTGRGVVGAGDLP